MSNHATIVSFVLEKAADEPVSKRIQLYRSLADMIGNEPETAMLMAQANALEQAEIACAQFAFNFNLPKPAPKTKAPR